MSGLEHSSELLPLFSNCLVVVFSIKQHQALFCLPFGNTCSKYKHWHQLEVSNLSACMEKVIIADIYVAGDMIKAMSTITI